MAISIRVSVEGYKQKPSMDEYRKQVYKLKNLDNVKVARKQLGALIETGHSFILAEFNEAGSILADNVKQVELLGLDVDSKDNPISMQEFMQLIQKDLGITPVIAYPTFSDKGDFKKFRLIYRFYKPICRDEYKVISNGLYSLYNKYLDRQAININRVWQGTNKAVVVNYNDVCIDEKVIEKIKTFIPVEAMTNISYENMNTRALKFEGNLKKLNNMYIKGKYKHECSEWINKSIDIVDFLYTFYGWQGKKEGNRIVGRCPLHNGDNKRAFVVFTQTNTYSCFTECGTGNIITLAQKFFNTTDFSSIIFQLMAEYSTLEIESDWVGYYKF